MGVAFFLGFIILLIIVGIMFVSFVTGIILLIVGNVKRKKAQGRNTNKTLYKVFMIFGAIMTVVPLAITVFVVAAGAIAQLEDQKREEYYMVNVVRNDDYELLEQLLEDGADPDSNDYDLFRGNIETSSNGETPLDAACNGGEYEMAKLLLEYGADPDKISQGQTPLYGALFNHHYDVIELLLQNGADVEGEEPQDTYLISACRTGDVKAVKILLEYGANPNVVDSDGKKLLEYENTRYKYIPDYNTPPADEEDCARIIELLKQYGATL